MFSVGETVFAVNDWELLEGTIDEIPSDGPGSIFHNCYKLRIPHINNPEGMIFWTHRIFKTKIEAARLARTIIQIRITEARETISRWELELDKLMDEYDLLGE